MLCKNGSMRPSETQLWQNSWRRGCCRWNVHISQTKNQFHDGYKINFNNHICWDKIVFWAPEIFYMLHISKRQYHRKSTRQYPVLELIKNARALQSPCSYEKNDSASKAAYRILRSMGRIWITTLWQNAITGLKTVVNHGIAVRKHRRLQMVV